MKFRAKPQRVEPRKTDDDKALSSDKLSRKTSTDIYAVPVTAKRVSPNRGQGRY